MLSSCRRCFLFPLSLSKPRISAQDFCLLPIHLLTVLWDRGTAPMIGRYMEHSVFDNSFAYRDISFEISTSFLSCSSLCCCQESNCVKTVWQSPCNAADSFGNGTHVTEDTPTKGVPSLVLQDPQCVFAVGGGVDAPRPAEHRVRLWETTKYQCDNGHSHCQLTHSLSPGITSHDINWRHLLFSC